MTLLLDTGAVYAYFDRDDAWHNSMRTVIDDEPGPLVLPSVVIPEIDHLLGARIGAPAQLAFYEDLSAAIYVIVDLDVGRYPRILELNLRYADLRLGFVDAAVAAVSEQLGIHRLATTDRRHFPAIGHDIDLELLPVRP